MGDSPDGTKRAQISLNLGRVSVSVLSFDPIRVRALCVENTSSDVLALF